MCLAIPARVVNVHGDVAEVDFGEGVLREVNIALVEVRIDDSSHYWFAFGLWVEYPGDGSGQGSDNDQDVLNFTCFIDDLTVTLEESRLKTEELSCWPSFFC